MRETNHLFVLTLFFYQSRNKKIRTLTMDYAIFARTSIMRYRSVIIFLPKILSSRRRKMVTYHNGPQPQRGSKGFTDRQFYTGIKRKKNKLDCAFFLPGELFFFSSTTPFRCVIRNLLFFVYVFLPGEERKRSDASAPTSMCVCLFICACFGGTSK